MKTGEDIDVGDLIQFVIKEGRTGYSPCNYCIGIVLERKLEEPFLKVIPISRGKNGCVDPYCSKWLLDYNDDWEIILLSKNKTKKTPFKGV